MVMLYASGEKKLVDENNNNREFIERFWRLKALYSWKKNRQRTNTHYMCKSVVYKQANQTYRN